MGKRLRTQTKRFGLATISEDKPGLFSVGARELIVITPPNGIVQSGQGLLLTRARSTERAKHVEALGKNLLGRIQQRWEGH